MGFFLCCNLSFLSLINDLTYVWTETLVHLILLARNFERAGDHIVNIARQVHQIVTGEDLKASS